MTQQLDNINKILLPIFGFHSIIDYAHVLIFDELDNKVVDQLNDKIDIIMSGFKKRHFNLYKNDGKLKTTNQAFNLLKRCLLDLNIPFEIFNKKCKGTVFKCMRLSPIKKIVYDYIFNMEAEICTPNNSVNADKQYVYTFGIDGKSAKLKLSADRIFFPDLKKIDCNNIFADNAIRQKEVMLDDGDYEIVDIHGPARKITIKNHSIDHIDYYLFKDGKHENMYLSLTWIFDGNLLYRKFAGQPEELWTKKLKEDCGKKFDDMLFKAYPEYAPLRTKFETIKLGQPIECFEKNYVIKDFYLKTINANNLKVGYMITMGGGRFGYHPAGKTHSVSYDEKTEMFKLLFYKKCINAISDIPKEFKNCLLFNTLKWIRPSVRCMVVDAVAQPDEEIVIEYYDASNWTPPNEKIYTYTLSHDTNSENIILIDVSAGIGGCEYLDDYENNIIVGNSERPLPERLKHIEKFVNKTDN